MQGLTPQQVETKDAFSWFNQSIELINRHLLGYFFSILSFFACLLAMSQAIQFLLPVVPATILLFLFLFAGAFLFYFIIAALVMVSYCADHNETITIKLVMQQFFMAQRAFLVMTVLTLMIGVFYWCISMLSSPSSDIISMSEKAITLLSSEQNVFFYALKTSAVFLYFLLIVMFFLRTFFSVPLIIFHGLSYSEAKALSHKGVFKNIRPMSYVMMVWFVIFSIATIFAPMLALVAMPLFSAFCYVAYRHVFLGRGTHKVAIKNNTIVAAS